MDLFNFFILLGRVLISALFLWHGVRKVMHWHHSSNVAKEIGVPQHQIVFPVSVALQIIGGLSVLLGIFSRFGAILLIIYLIPTIYWFHCFWKHKEVERKKIEQAMFMKSLAVLGGLFLILAIGSGRFGF